MDRPALTEPSLGESAQTVRLGRVDRLAGLLEAPLGAGLHLADGKGLAVERDDVQLSLGAAPVPLQDVQAVRAEPAGGDLLPIATQPVVRAAACRRAAVGARAASDVRVRAGRPTRSTGRGGVVPV